MATFKSNMAQAASDMLDLPTNLEGILQDVNGQKEVKSSETSLTEYENVQDEKGHEAENKPRKERKTAKVRQEASRGSKRR